MVYRPLGSPTPLALPLLAIISAIWLAGCGADDKNTPPAAPIIESFEVGPEHLEAPGDVTLTWATEGARSLELLQGTEPVDLEGLDLAQGSIVLAVSESTTFTLEAKNAGGSATASRDVTVDALQGPVIAAFDGPTYAELSAEGEATVELSWAGVERADTLRLEAEGRGPIELDAAAPAGSLEVRITEDTTFTLVAANQADEASRSVTVLVAHLPVIEIFEADRLLVGSGEAAAVHWVSAGAAYVELWQDELRLLEEGPSQGSEVVTFVAPSTLELRATNVVGTTVTATLEIDVGPPWIDEVLSSADVLWLGESIGLSWETLGGSSLDIFLESTGEAICVIEGYAAMTASSCEWQPREVGDYSIIFSLANLSGVSSRRFELTVGDGPTITRFGAGPEALTVGEDIEISWAALGDPSGTEPTVRITDDRGNVYDDDAGPEGTLTATLLEPGPYELRMEATTDDPRSVSREATATVLVHPRPTMEFEASLSHFDDSIDEEVVISWTTEDAATLILYLLDGETQVQVLEVPEEDRAEGSYAVVPKEVQRYRLVAANALGWEVASEVEITVAPTEVLTFLGSPTSFTQGQPVHLSWTTRMADEVRINLGTERYLLEETEAPYLDLPQLGGSRLPLTTACGPIDTLGCAQVQLPDGFSFPFGDSSFSQVWVHTTGHLSFDHVQRPDSIDANQRFPTDPKHAAIGMAPFWDSLAWERDRYPAGNVYTAQLEEDGDPIFVIQWRDVGYATGSVSSRTASFNFEVVLRQDGSFDYRYGSQSVGGSTLDSAIINGSSATIGFQLPDQKDHGLILFNGEGNINGLRNHRTFSYRPLTLPLDGELVFRPLGPQPDFPITLTAKRGERTHSRTLNFNVARKPMVELNPEVLAPAPMGADFLIGWTSSNAVTLVVLDEEGEVRCTAPNQQQINSGVCVLSEAEGGRYEYTVRVTGANGSAAEKTIAIDVFGAFGITSFTAEENRVEKGSDLLLQWETFETVSVTLYADGVEIYSDGSGAPAGSFVVEGLEKATEFTLIATNDVGATHEESLSVDLLPITFGLQISGTQVRPGDPITVTLDAKVLDGGAPLKVYGIQPLGEVPAPSDRFEDITYHPNVRLQAIVSSRSQVALPFPFPYMGGEYESLFMFIHGYVSFSPNPTQNSINSLLPTFAGTSNDVHLAPFWDQLSIRGRGTLLSAPIDNDTFVLQWTNFSFNNPSSSNTNPQNLNFQIVLKRNGSFEYRFGPMEPHPTFRPTSGCFPDTCVNEVNGSSATIGYQQINGAAGHNFHFGGTNPAEGNEPVLGGLSHRTFRYTVIDGSGSFTFGPNRDEDLILCVDHAGETFCREVPLQAPFGFSSVTVSADQIESGQSVTLSWQSTGGRSLRILDRDTVVYSTSDLAEIDLGSISLTPTRNTIYDLELVAGGRQEFHRKLVEVNRLSLTASATTSSGPGQPITISWNLGSSDPSADLYVLAPMEEISNTDFSTFDLDLHPDARVLLGAGSDAQVADLDFVDFTFPYFGVVHSSIRVATDGYLSFGRGESHPSNNPLPGMVSNAARANPAMAPFWDDIHTRLRGRILAKKIDADHYVIQWSGVSLRWGTVDANQGNLNFLVVLGRDGSFEYRFGYMEPPVGPAASTSECNPVSCERETNGSSATIGYQLPDASIGHQIHFGGLNRALAQPTVPGGLSDRAWRFTPQRAVGTGSATIHPTESSLQKICAIEAKASEVICAPAMPLDVPWRIDLFQANPEAPSPGEPVSLHWSVQGAAALRILEGETELLSQTGTSVQLLGTLPITLSATTTYTLEIGWMDRTLRQDLTVQRRTFDLAVTAPPAVVFPGDVVTINWELTQQGTGTPVMIAPLSELPIGPNGEDGYVDVSQMQGAQQITLSGNNGFANVSIPFPFPYLGTPQSTMQVFAGGYISFTGNGGNSNGNNLLLPDSGNLPQRIQMAVFWDDLILRGGDSLWRYSPDPSTLIIQWKGVSRAVGSSASVRYDLNFQVVLRADGSFDYRYGTMAPPAPPFSDTSCFPDDCSNEANGSSATIGYQTVGGLYGSTLHIGSFTSGAYTSPADGFLAFPGGLSNRSFRHVLAPTGSSKVVVGRTGGQEVCAILGDFAACKSAAVTVVAGGGELMITEALIDPAAGQQRQWFEVRNLTDRVIDMQGLELRSNQGSHRIAGPLPVAPRGFVTLAASNQVPFTPDYVYNDEVPLNRNLDNLELLAGHATINKMAWGLGWTVSRDQVLSLDPSRHLNGVQENVDFGSWCPAGSTGTPGSLGAGCLSPWYEIDPASDRPFIDIALTGTRFHDIEETSRLARLPSTGFEVNLFGEKFSRLWVSSRGWVSLHDFQPTATTTHSTSAPNAFPRTEAQVGTMKGPVIGAFWAPLQCHGTCQVFFERRVVSGEDVLIIQWENFQFVLSDDGRAGSLTAQLQLWANGDVVTSYRVSNPYPAGHIRWSPFQGSTAWIGLEALDPNVFVEAHAKRPMAFDQRSIYFRAKWTG